MKTYTWIIALIVSWLVTSAFGAEAKQPARKRIEIRSPLPGANAILTMVKDGTKVEEGDLLITLDSSGLQAELERLRIEVAAATAEIVAAKTGLRRAEIESHKTDVAALALKVAELRCNAHSAELDAEMKTIEREIEVAQKSLDLVKRHVKNTVGDTGAGNSLEEAAAELEILKAEAALETATNKKRLLEIMRPLKEAELELDMKQTEMELAMMKLAAAEELEVARASLAAHEQKLQMEKDRLERIEELIALSDVRAPSNGTVQYVVKGVAAEGALVRERQPLLLLIRE